MSRHRATPTLRTIVAEHTARAIYAQFPRERFRPLPGRHRRWTDLERRTWPLMAAGIRP